jgi:hydrogenase maturation protein HypF
VRSPATAAASTAIPIEAAVARLRAGGVVALKGLGGFHLACDARDADAGRRAARRKRREAKPFAVMVRRSRRRPTLVELDAEARALLGVAGPAHRRAAAPAPARPSPPRSRRQPAARRDARVHAAPAPRPRGSSTARRWS